MKEYSIGYKVCTGRLCSRKRRAETDSDYSVNYIQIWHKRGHGESFLILVGRGLFLQQTAESDLWHGSKKNRSYGGWHCCHAHIIRTGSQFLCHVQHMWVRRPYRGIIIHLWSTFNLIAVTMAKMGNYSYIRISWCYRGGAECSIQTEHKAYVWWDYCQSCAYGAWYRAFLQRWHTSTEYRL